MSYRTTRRRFLGGSLAGAVFCGSVGGGRLVSAATSAADLATARREAAARRRRIVYNNDGDDIWAAGVNSIETFLADRHEPLLGTQVDSVHYSTTQSFNYFTHDTRIAERFLIREGIFSNSNLEAFLAQKTDGLRLSAEFAHRHGWESIWSLRMNDIHDVAEPLFIPQWKRDDPRRVMTSREDGLSHNDRRRLWSLVDYEHPDVAPRLTAIVEETLQNYPVDGVELDWMRAPFYFRTAYAGEPATAAQVDVLSRLVRTLRGVVLRESERQGRPLLLSSRVPVTREACRQIGIDVAAWLEEGLLDTLAVSGGYVPFAQPVQGLIELGHKHNVQVYPCISKSGMAHRPPRIEKESPMSPESWFAAAQRCFALGADGIYSFNLFPNGKSPETDYARTILSRIGELETLRGASKTYVVSDAALYMPSAFWAKDVEEFTGGLPVNLQAEGATQLPPLIVYDALEDVGAATSAELLLDFTDLDGDVAPPVMLNGVELKPAGPAESVAQVRRLRFVAPTTGIRSGDNLVSVGLRHATAQVVGAELWLKRDAS